MVSSTAPCTADKLFRALVDKDAMTQAYILVSRLMCADYTNVNHLGQYTNVKSTERAQARSKPDDAKYDGLDMSVDRCAVRANIDLREPFDREFFHVVAKMVDGFPLAGAEIATHGTCFGGATRPVSFTPTSSWHPRY